MNKLYESMLNVGKAREVTGASRCRLLVSLNTGVSCGCKAAQPTPTDNCSLVVAPPPNNRPTTHPTQSFKFSQLLNFSDIYVTALAFYNDAIIKSSPNKHVDTLVDVFLIVTRL